MHSPNIQWTLLAIIGMTAMSVLALSDKPDPGEKPSVAAPTAPLEQHKALAAFVGDFELVSTINIGPKAPPLTAHATSHGEWIMGGRFVEVKSINTPSDPFKGERLLIYGYDPAISKYTLLNLDTGSLFSTTATGDYDAATQTFTFNGEKSSPTGAPIHFKWLLKIKPDGAIEQTILVGAATGPLTEVVSVVHTPKKK